MQEEDRLVCLELSLQRFCAVFAEYGLNGALECFQHRLLQHMHGLRQSSALSTSR